MFYFEIISIILVGFILYFYLRDKFENKKERIIYSILLSIIANGVFFSTLFFNYLGLGWMIVNIISIVTAIMIIYENNLSVKGTTIVISYIAPILFYWIYLLSVLIVASIFRFSPWYIFISMIIVIPLIVLFLIKTIRTSIKPHYESITKSEIKKGKIPQPIYYNTFVWICYILLFTTFLSSDYGSIPLLKQIGFLGIENRVDFHNLDNELVAKKLYSLGTDFNISDVRDGYVSDDYYYIVEHDYDLETNEVTERLYSYNIESSTSKVILELKETTYFNGYTFGATNDNSFYLYNDVLYFLSADGLFLIDEEDTIRLYDVHYQEAKFYENNGLHLFIRDRLDEDAITYHLVEIEADGVQTTKTFDPQLKSYNYLILVNNTILFEKGNNYYFDEDLTDHLTYTKDSLIYFDENFVVTRQSRFYEEYSNDAIIVENRATNEKFKSLSSDDLGYSVIKIENQYYLFDRQEWIGSNIVVFDEDFNPVIGYVPTYVLTKHFAVSTYQRYIVYFSNDNQLYQVSFNKDRKNALSELSIYDPIIDIPLINNIYSIHVLAMLLYTWIYLKSYQAYYFNEKFGTKDDPAKNKDIIEGEEVPEEETKIIIPEEKQKNIYKI